MEPDKPWVLPLTMCVSLGVICGIVWFLIRLWLVEEAERDKQAAPENAPEPAPERK